MKAFDSVDHLLPIQKHLGAIHPMLSRFRTYYTLIDRKHLVKIHNSVSEQIINVTSGVLQGIVTYLSPVCICTTFTKCLITVNRSLKRG